MFSSPFVCGGGEPGIWAGSLLPAPVFGILEAESWLTSRLS